MTAIPAVWLIAAALPIILVVAWAFGSIARWLLRGRARLGVATANSYVMHRWPLSLGATVAAQFRAAVRFSEQR